MTNKLVDEVQKTIQDEQNNEKLELEKRKIRAMLIRIEHREKRISDLQEEIKDLRDKLEKKDYSPVMPVRQDYKIIWKIV